MQRLRPLSEAECYLRCYGQRSDDAVKVLAEVPPEPARPSALAERIRILLETQIAAGEPAA